MFSLVSGLRFRERWHLCLNKKITQVPVPPKGCDYSVVSQDLVSLKKILKMGPNRSNQFAQRRGICHPYWEHEGDTSIGLVIRNDLRHFLKKERLYPLVASAANRILVACLKSHCCVQIL